MLLHSISCWIFALACLCAAPPVPGEAWWIHTDGQKTIWKSTEGELVLAGRGGEIERVLPAPAGLTRNEAISVEGRLHVLQVVVVDETTLLRKVDPESGEITPLAELQGRRHCYPVGYQDGLKVYCFVDFETAELIVVTEDTGVVTIALPHGRPGSADLIASTPHIIYSYFGGCTIFDFKERKVVARWEAPDDLQAERIFTASLPVVGITESDGKTLEVHRLEFGDGGAPRLDRGLYRLAVSEPGVYREIDDVLVAPDLLVVLIDETHANRTTTRVVAVDQHGGREIFTAEGGFDFVSDVLPDGTIALAARGSNVRGNWKYDPNTIRFIQTARE